MRFRLWSILSFVCLLSSCQSNRLAAFRPAVSAYHPVLLAQTPPLTPDSTGTSRPVFEASASSSPEVPLVKLAHPASALAGATAFGRKQSKLPVDAGVVPDTLWGRPVGPGWPLAEPPRTPVPASAPDPSTFIVNMIGGGLLLSILLTLLIGPGSKPYSGLSGLLAILSLLALVPISVVLLLYQGKNGRQRLKREARRQARTGVAPSTDTNLSPTTNATPPVVTTSPRNQPLRKVGIGLMLGGSLLLIFWAVLGFYAFILILPSIILIITGLVISISAI